jgi:diguanylate cyclase (GGDEF)-like protein
VFTLIVSLAYAVAFVAIAVQVLRLGNQAGPARWMLALPYAAAGIGLLARAGTMLLDPAAYPGLFVQSTIHTISFLGLFAVTCSGSIAFLLMLREYAEADLRRLAMFDTLTGMYNRRALMDLAERELARSRRSGAPCAILMIDLDRFKRVNDEFGHQAGDRVLAEFGAVAKNSLRTEDLVGRYGGEEFCAVLPGAGTRVALGVAERLRAAVAGRPLGGLPRATTVSIGVAAGEGGADELLDDAVARADAALYRAKREGRNRVVSTPSVEPDHPADFADEDACADAVGAQFSRRPVEQAVN